MNSKVFLNTALALSILLVMEVSGADGADSDELSGPQVPCVDCPELERVLPSPETGIWFNPQQSGSGFMLEFQNRQVGGYYFLYDEFGEPVWYAVAGRLEPGDDEARWILETDLVPFHGGACLNCPFQPPQAGDPVGTLQFEFLGRNWARFRVDDGPAQYVVPLTFGVGGKAEFAPITNYVLPDLEGDWAIFIEDGLETTAGATKFRRVEVEAGEAVSVRYEARRISIVRTLWSPPPPKVIGQFECYGSPEFGPLCEILWFREDGQFLLADISDSRMVGESEDGRVLRMFRLDYD